MNTASPDTTKGTPVGSEAARVLTVIELLAKKYGSQVYLAYFHEEEDCSRF